LGERSAIDALYDAKIEMCRRTTPAREIAAAVRAIHQDRLATIRAMMERRRNGRVAFRERRKIMHHGEITASKNMTRARL
jgi:hypothetical protein